MATLGAYRVGTGFNPGGEARVDRIKRLAAELIDEIDGIDPRDRSPEVKAEIGRLKALAMTAVEQAAMWAVKAVTKPDWHVTSD